MPVEFLTAETDELYLLALPGEDDDSDEDDWDDELDEGFDDQIEDNNDLHEIQIQDDALDIDPDDDDHLPDDDLQ